MDSAPGHVAQKTYVWLDERKVKYIMKDEWMANSPDLSPMDYGINGHFKELLKGKKARFGASRAHRETSVGQIQNSDNS